MEAFVQRGRPSNGSSSSSKRQNSSEPWMEHVTIQHESLGHGSYDVTCSYCNMRKRHTYARITAHLGHERGKGVQPCPVVPDDVKAQFDPAQPSTTKRQLIMMDMSRHDAVVPAVNAIARFVHANAIPCNALAQEPHKWWQTYGASTQALQRAAKTVLSQVPNASPCERNWSAYDWVLSKKRNCLTAERAQKWMSSKT
jgi:hypothetical protein